MHARILLAVALLASCIGCDQATKQLATEQLRDLPAQSYLAGTVRLVYAQNPGGFLSLGDSLSPNARFIVFTLANFGLLAAVAYVLIRYWDMRLAMFIGLLVILAGGIGNLIDRIVHHGLVTDFLVLGIWPVQTGIINFADVALTLGGLACAVVYVAGRKVRAGCVS
jgi:signal peptidase II